MWCSCIPHPGPVILPELDERLGAYAQKKLAERGVEIRVNTKDTAISDQGIALSDGTMTFRALTVSHAEEAGSPALTAKGQAGARQTVETMG